MGTSFRRLLQTLLPGTLLALLLLGGVFAAGEQIRFSTIGSSGARLASGSVVMQNSIGQPIVGAVGDTQQVCAGLFCGVGAPPLIIDIDETYDTHLPMIVR